MFDSVFPPFKGLMWCNVRKHLGNCRDRSRTPGGAAPPDLPTVLGKVFLENHLSARRTHELAVGAVVSGAQKMNSFASAGNFGRHPGNMCRDMTRRIARSRVSNFPKPYWVTLQLWDHKEGCVVNEMYPMYLPHELLAYEVEQRGLQQLLASPGTELFDLVGSFAQDCEVPADELVPMGLWGDGVPFTKSSSLELLTLNFVGDATGQRHVLVGADQRCFCQCGCKGRHTWDGLFQVLKWSFIMCMLRTWPTRRHDGQEWGQGDGLRSKMAGLMLPCHAGLVQIRGDWMWYCQVLDLPHWGSNFICPWCKANCDDCPWTDVGPDAAWRTQRIAERDFFNSLKEQGGSPNPLFSSPGVSISTVHVDWLHCVDLGCAADVLGCTLWEALPFLHGSSRKMQVRSLWRKLQRYYSSASVSSKLEKLSVEGLWRRNAKAPKLSAKGAQCRGVLPFSHQLASEIFAQTQCNHWGLITKCNQELLSLSQVVMERPYRARVASAHCLAFASTWASLTQEEGSVWVLKPKLHMLQECVEMFSTKFGPPSNYWTYKDEDLGGQCAALAHRRGGGISRAGFGERLLKRISLLAA